MSNSSPPQDGKSELLSSLRRTLDALQRKVGDAELHWIQAAHELKDARICRDQASTSFCGALRTMISDAQVERFVHAYDESEREDRNLRQKMARGLDVEWENILEALHASLDQARATIGKREEHDRCRRDAQAKEIEALKAELASTLEKLNDEQELRRADEKRRSMEDQCFDHLAESYRHLEIRHYETKKEAEEARREAGEARREADEARREADEVKKEADEVKKAAGEAKNEAEEAKKAADEAKKAADEVWKEADKTRRKAYEVGAELAARLKAQRPLPGTYPSSGYPQQGPNAFNTSTPSANGPHTEQETAPVHPFISQAQQRPFFFPPRQQQNPPPDLTRPVPANAQQPCQQGCVCSQCMEERRRVQEKRQRQAEEHAKQQMDEFMATLPAKIEARAVELSEPHRLRAEAEAENARRAEAKMKEAQEKAHLDSLTIRQLQMALAAKDTQLRQRALHRPGTEHASWNTYEGAWSMLGGPLSFSAVPWPMLDVPKCPDDITLAAVRTFLLNPSHSAGQPNKDRVKKALLRWHPDKFHTRMHRVADADKEAVAEAVKRVAGYLNALMQECS